MKQFTMPIIFWLMTIEDKKIREAAIRNAHKDNYLDERDNLSSSIDGAFTWSLTPEGHKYWKDFYYLCAYKDLEINN